jgi:regulatory protein
MAHATLSLKAKALRLLAQRDHSRVELRRKLLAHLAAATNAERHAAAAEPPPEACAADVDRLLDEFQARGLLSDSRFVESRVNARAPRFGIARIRDELARHGVELDPPAARGLGASEAERALAVWTRKFGQPAVDARGRARQMRFLAGRGFAADVVRRVVPPARGDGSQSSRDG